MLLKCKKPEENPVVDKKILIYIDQYFLSLCCLQQYLFWSYLPLFSHFGIITKIHTPKLGGVNVVGVVGADVVGVVGADAVGVVGADAVGEVVPVGFLRI
jgi:hypothetical protein